MYSFDKMEEMMIDFEDTWESYNWEEFYAEPVWSSFDYDEIRVPADWEDDWNKPQKWDNEGSYATVGSYATEGSYDTEGSYATEGSYDTEGSYATISTTKTSTTTSTEGSYSTASTTTTTFTTSEGSFARKIESAKTRKVGNALPLGKISIYKVNIRSIELQGQDFNETLKSSEELHIKLCMWN